MTKQVIPKAFMIAETATRPVEMRRFLEAVGVPDWRTDTGNDAEQLIEVAGRLCYKSFGTDLNPNLTKVREGNHGYVGNLLRQAHGSVFRHATVTFAFLDVSRVFTHEIVRHAAGVDPSQESLRFVRPTELKAYYPEAFGEDAIGELYDALVKAGKLPPDDGAKKWAWVQHRMDFLRAKFWTSFERAEEVHKEVVDALYLDELDGGFGVKKRLTSAMRRMLPDGMATNIILTANHQAWRHVISMRTSEGAEEEARLVVGDVATQLKARFPAVYQDLRWTHPGVATFEHGV